MACSRQADHGARHRRRLPRLRRLGRLRRIGPQTATPAPATGAPSSPANGVAADLSSPTPPTAATSIRFACRGHTRASAAHGQPRRSGDGRPRRISIQRRRRMVARPSARRQPGDRLARRQSAAAGGGRFLSEFRQRVDFGGHAVHAAARADSNGRQTERRRMAEGRRDFDFHGESDRGLPEGRGRHVAAGIRRPRREIRIAGRSALRQDRDSVELRVAVWLRAVRRRGARGAGAGIRAVSDAARRSGVAALDGRAADRGRRCRSSARSVWRGRVGRQLSRAVTSRRSANPTGKPQRPRRQPRGGSACTGRFTISRTNRPPRR